MSFVFSQITINVFIVLKDSWSNLNYEIFEKIPEYPYEENLDKMFPNESLMDYNFVQKMMDEM